MEVLDGMYAHCKGQIENIRFYADTRVINVSLQVEDLTYKAEGLNMKKPKRK